MSEEQPELVDEFLNEFVIATLIMVFWMTWDITGYWPIGIFTTGAVAAVLGHATGDWDNG